MKTCNFPNEYKFPDEEQKRRNQEHINVYISYRQHIMHLENSRNAFHIGQQACRK